jgi:hypothetical protein
LTALATPEVASQIVGIVVGSTIKGLIDGAIVLPGSIVGRIVGYTTHQFGQGREAAAR